MELVFNEWFVEYMVPESSKVRLVSELLTTLEARGDRLVIRRESPFAEKFYRLNKLYGNLGQPSRPVFKRFALLLYNANSVRFVEEEEIPTLPEEMLVGVSKDDAYLAEIAALTHERTIITTDTGLKAGLDGKEGFKVILLDDFLTGYLPAQR